MATTIGQRLPKQERATRWMAAIAAGAAGLVLACGAGVAVLISQTPASAPAASAPHITQVHATGRGLQPGLGSYTTSAVGATSQTGSYASGRGGVMETADLELPAAAHPFSQPRGGVPETADLR